MKEGIGLFGLTTGLCEMMRRWGKRQNARWLAARPSINTHQLYFQYYEGSGLREDAVTGAWYGIARILGVDAEKLRPADKLADLRAMPRWVSTCTPVESVVDDLLFQVHLSAAGARVPAPQPVTIDDVLRFLATYDPEMRG